MHSSVQESAYAEAAHNWYYRKYHDDKLAILRAENSGWVQLYHNVVQNVNFDLALTDHGTDTLFYIKDHAGSATLAVFKNLYI